MEVDSSSKNPQLGVSKIIKKKSIKKKKKLKRNRSISTKNVRIH